MNGLAVSLLVLASVVSALQTLQAPKPVQRKIVRRKPVGKPVQQAAKQVAQFDWFKQWYPVNVVATMDGSRPTKFELLGMKLVAWLDGESWRVFEDMCPHRGAALSEGRIEDGTLMCSYHGWRFDGDGGCTSLPYSPASMEGRHRTNARCACTSFPTKVVDGLLFVYAKPDAIEAQSVPLPLIKEVRDGGDSYIWKIPAGVRDFPCNWDAMLENTLDPAHFCAAHHGTLGNRYVDPKPYQFRTSRSLDTADGFAVDGDFGSLEFLPPCLATFKPNYPGMPFRGNLVIATYCVPTKPGWVRPLATVLLDKDARLGNTLAERALAVFMHPATPAWLGHILSSVVLHQDAGLLYSQSRNFRDKGMSRAAFQGKSYEALAFCPNSADKAVMTFRNWLRTRAGNGVPWACDDVLPARGSEDIFDMWHAHTVNCKYCTAVYARLRALTYSATAAAIFAAAFMPDGPDRVLATLASACAAAGFHQFSGLFRRYEFHHADNH